MEKAQNSSRKMPDPACGADGERGKSGTKCMCSTVKPEPPRKKGWWARYVERLKKHEGDVRSCCH